MLFPQRLSLTIPKPLRKKAPAPPSCDRRAPKTLEGFRLWSGGSNIEHSSLVVNWNDGTLRALLLSSQKRMRLAQAEARREKPLQRGENTVTKPISQDPQVELQSDSTLPSGTGKIRLTGQQAKAAEITQFLARVQSWPKNPKDDGASGYINVHWMVPRPGDKPWMRGGPVRTIVDFQKLVRWVLAQPDTSDIYFCTSLQRTAKKNAGGRLKAVRSKENALAFKAVWLDIDIRPKGYATVQEAFDALFEFIARYHLPPPSAIITSGGGVHVYWISDRSLSVDEWRLYAEGLKAAVLEFGLRCDAGCTTNPVQLLRVPGTFNFKTDPPQPVSLSWLQGEDIDFATDLKVLLEIAPAPRKGNGADADQFEGIEIAPAFRDLPSERIAAGIVVPEYPPLPLAPLMQGCGFIRTAVLTGGKDYREPLWNFTTLCAVFLENGHELAHRMGDQHPGYSEASTEKKWTEKQRAHEGGVGWPSCKAIDEAFAGSDCTSPCKKCPHFAKSKSPLDLALQVAAPTETLATSIIWDPAKLRVSYANVRHRPWLYGTYLMRGEVTIIAAPGGVGKTAWTTGVATEIVVGTVLMDERIWGDNLKVLSINGEDGKEEITRRMWAFALAHIDKITEQPPDNFYAIGADDDRIQALSFLQTNEKNRTTLDSNGFAILESLIAAVGPDVVMLDPLVVFCSGGDMNGPVMAQVMRKLKSLAMKYDCAILIVHHNRKGGERDDQESIANAAAIVNLARCALMPVPMTKDEATGFGVLPSERHRYFRLANAKPNFTPKSEDSPWYKLHSIQLPNDEPPLYQTGDNVQAVARVNLPLPKTASEAANNQKIQRAILDLVERGKLIERSRYPYSPNLSGAKNQRAFLDDAIAVVQHVTAPRQWLAEDLQAVVHAAIGKMKGDRWIYQDVIKTGRFHGGSALHVDWGKTPWPKPASALDGERSEDELDHDVAEVMRKKLTECN
jgi:hypothetical protein